VPVNASANPTRNSQGDLDVRTHPFERTVIVGADSVEGSGPTLGNHVGDFLREQVDPADVWHDGPFDGEAERSTGRFGVVLDRTLHGQLTRPLTDLAIFDEYLAVTRGLSHDIIRRLDGRRSWVFLQGAVMLAVPAALRAERPELRITLRLPTPWPAPELFARLPWRTQLLAGAAGADVISLPSELDRKNLTRSFGRYLPNTGVATRKGRVMLGDGRRVRTIANPPTLDVDRLIALSADAAVESDLALWQRRLGDRQLVLAVERLHASSGLLEQLGALERLLERENALAVRAAFLIVADADGDDDSSTRRAIERAVGRINGRFTRPGGDVPVQYLHGGVPRSTLAALFRLARVLVATPLAAGASIAVKEYVTVQHAFGRKGRVLLSETSGTAAELPMLASCNPFAPDEVARGIAAALATNDTEAERTLAAAATQIRRFGLAAWWRREVAVAEDPTAELVAHR
jgi:trehalose 6-phosphate synthase